MKELPECERRDTFLPCSLFIPNDNILACSYHDNKAMNRDEKQRVNNGKENSDESKNESASNSKTEFVVIHEILYEFTQGFFGNKISNLSRTERYVSPISL